MSLIYQARDVLNEMNFIEIDVISTIRNELDLPFDAEEYKKFLLEQTKASDINFEESIKNLTLTLHKLSDETTNNLKINDIQK
ncbi:MAG: hypothetical protein CVV64_19515 [Candidatus Wallbacteria bacterium HGW-Wallbacteria-1]|jgi:hypothetical protein|uniref:Uncharacterized protein n=1 Tax=Candidatus Wallbacteria bacterium HGW-Wallbacteria-1 TaxID=2013854 RepID=A0A2N1PIZ6_9BACT|nr:MAG: hypothetical protein CVV64_19515 [Candidatus Wallbacteria bacterium HGW-Wallbacteria-1]